MAISNLSNLSGVLSQVYSAKLERQLNTLAQVASMIPTEPGGGKAIGWEVQLGGSTAYNHSEGKDITDAEFNTRNEATAVLPWAAYTNSFQVSELQLRAAASSQGTASALVNVFGERMENAIADLASKINSEIINGTGTATAPTSDSVPSIYGLLNSALAASGTYAGISRSGNPLWAGNQLSNGGTGRPLTSDLFTQARRLIKQRTGLGINGIVMDTYSFAKFMQTFDAKERVVVNNGNTRYNTGSDDIYWNGAKIVEDKDMPAGTVILGDWSKVRKVYLPNTPAADQPGAGNLIRNMISDNGDALSTDIGLPCKVEFLAKGGDSVKVMVLSYLQLRVVRPAAFCVISDLAVGQ